jgi:hypothetical protein
MTDSITDSTAGIRMIAPQSEKPTAITVETPKLDMILKLEIISAEKPKNVTLL